MNENTRQVDALENIAAELERLRLLYEYAYGARVEHTPEGDPYVVRREER